MLYGVNIDLFSYVRLFLRKTAAWHRINRLGYYGDISDLPAAADELFKIRSIPVIQDSRQRNSRELIFLSEIMLETSYSFADGSDDHISSLEEACLLLKLDELKIIAKEARLQGKNKGELIDALRRTSQGQGGLGWFRLKRSNTGQSIESETLDGLKCDTVENAGVSNVNRDAYFLGKILAEVGPCIRLSSTIRKLFERVHLVFYRSTDWTEKSLISIILARISKRNFPDYLVSRSTNIFLSRLGLLEFEASVRMQFQIDDILEINGTVTKDGLRKAQEIFEEVYPRWKALLAEERQKEDRVYESGEGAYLRRFSPAWVYTRIVHKGAYVLGRVKNHDYEHRMLTELLLQTLFHAARRGSWYQRKALLEEHYMWALQPNEGRSEVAQKKHWKKIALQTCEDGLQDKDCHLIYHYDLQKRVMKLEKSLKVAKRQQHDFGHVFLAKAAERKVEGIRIQREKSPSRNASHRGSDVSNPRRGAKTIWVDEREGGGECGVEAMCLSWYRDQGWKGYHSEGGIVRTLVKLPLILVKITDGRTDTTLVRLPLLRRPLRLRPQRVSDPLPNMPPRPPYGCILSVPGLGNQPPSRRDL
jgi:fanconi-associated nuclease 1